MTTQQASPDPGPTPPVTEPGSTNGPNRSGVPIALAMQEPELSESLGEYARA